MRKAVDEVRNLQLLTRKSVHLSPCPAKAPIVGHPAKRRPRQLEEHGHVPFYVGRQLHRPPPGTLRIDPVHACQQVRPAGLLFVRRVRVLGERGARAPCVLGMRLGVDLRAVCERMAGARFLAPVWAPRPPTAGAASGAPIAEK